MSDAKPQYPQCAKLASVADESANIGEFIEWLESKGIMLGHNVQFEERSRPEFVPISTPTEKLLADFYGIDLVALEKEKREILESARALNK